MAWQARPLAMLFAGLVGLLGCHSSGSSGSGGSGHHHKTPANLPIYGQFQITHDVLSAQQMTLAIGDCNEDGLLDLVSINRMEPVTVHIRKPDGSLDPKTVSLNQMGYAGTFVDLDGDGHQDILLGENQAMFLRGHGDCTFDPPKALTPVVQARAAQISVSDVDQDGVQDIAITRFGMTDTPANLYLGRGDGTFVEAPLPVTPFSAGDSWLPWGTFWDDLDGDGIRDYIAVFDDARGWISFGLPGDLPTFQRDDAATTLFAPGGPMEVAPIDFDRDGQMEYYISRQNNLALLLKFQGRTATNVAEDANLIGNGAELWGSMSFDADLDGWTDLLVLQINAGSFPGATNFFHNNHDGTFTDAPKSVLDLDVWALFMVCGDILSDGHVVCYAVPLQGNPVAIANQLTPQGNWIGLHLKGTVSSAEAEGARVALYGANPPQLMYYGAQEPPSAQHDRGLIMAVGQQTSADIDITWPSGIHQHVSGLPIQQYSTIEEPKVVTVSKRVAKADGMDTVDIVVDPGLIGDDRPVTIEKSGAGDWTSDPQVVNGRTKRTLLAPSTPGSARVQISLGGTPLLVRPRITFVSP